MASLRVWLSALLSAGLITGAAAGDLERVPMDMSVADVMQTWPLIAAEREESTLRVAMHKLGPYPTTDVSPPFLAVLSIYVLFTEHGTAQGTWPIESVISMKNPRRVDAGIYAVDIKTYNAGESDCFEVERSLLVDARAATIAGRKSRPDFFEDAQINSPISVEVVDENCLPSTE